MEIKEYDAALKRVKVHYIGFGEEFDEWKDITDDKEFPIAKLIKLPTPSPDTLEVHSEKFCCSLLLEVKRRLRTGRKNDP